MKYPAPLPVGIFILSGGRGSTALVLVLVVEVGEDLVEGLEDGDLAVERLVRAGGSDIEQLGEQSLEGLFDLGTGVLVEAGVNDDLVVSVGFRSDHLESHRFGVGVDRDDDLFQCVLEFLLRELAPFRDAGLDNNCCHVCSLFYRRTCSVLHERMYYDFIA